MWTLVHLVFVKLACKNSETLSVLLKGYSIEKYSSIQVMLPTTNTATRW